MKAYKGMDKDMKCRGFQYEIGKEYETDKADACKSGFHACEYPLDVFRYYPPATSRFFEVEQSGELDKSDGDSHVASTEIKIGAELNIAGLVKAAVEYTKKHCKKEVLQIATSDREAASATSDKEASYATGKYGAASATGDYGAASATGKYGAASATGYQGTASATGNDGAAYATGSRGSASATGDYGAASATGDYGAASATGFHGAASATGKYGVAYATGHLGTASATGECSVAVACGKDGKAKGKIGCALFFAEKGDWYVNKYPIVNVKAVIVDGEKIKPNVWYTLKNGEIVEA